MTTSAARVVLMSLSEETAAFCRAFARMQAASERAYEVEIVTEAAGSALLEPD